MVADKPFFAAIAAEVTQALAGVVPAPTTPRSISFILGGWNAPAMTGRDCRHRWRRAWSGSTSRLGPRIHELERAARWSK
jgi:hypothetical protein